MLRWIAAAFPALLLVTAAHGQLATCDLQSQSTTPVTTSPGVSVGVTYVVVDQGNCAAFGGMPYTISISGDTTAGATLDPPTTATGSLAPGPQGFSVTPGASTGSFSVTINCEANCSTTGSLTWVVNVDAPPSISINDVTLNEGASGTTTFAFNVTLSNPSDQTITVDAATADGTATQPDDYTAVPTTTLTFPPNTTGPQTVSVLVNGDTTFEPTETFFVNLSNASNATIAGNQGLGTIINDDAPPSISINDVTLNEGASGTTTFTFNVTLSNPSNQTITVDAATADGTATQPGDYTAVPTTTLTFPPDTTGPQTVSVLVNGDTTFEPTETFFVNLSNASNATIADNQGLGTITNDDAPNTDLSITKTAPATAYVGVPFACTIVVTNNGPDDSTGSTVTDVLPANLTLVSAAPSQGSCSGTTTVTCTLGALANGATATITLTVTATAAGPTTNTATVVADDSDPNPGNSSSPATFAILPASAIPALSYWVLVGLALAMIGVAVCKMR